ncbi:MAG: hypothetical protein HXS54_03390 [Theionarchaea archaeon]|nr:hypothetical protein [Theionarchaea archaeon]
MYAKLVTPASNFSDPAGGCYALGTVPEWGHCRDGIAPQVGLCDQGAIKFPP